MLVQIRLTIDVPLSLTLPSIFSSWIFHSYKSIIPAPRYILFERIYYLERYQFCHDRKRRFLSTDCLYSWHWQKYKFLIRSSCRSRVIGDKLWILTFKHHSMWIHNFRIDLISQINKFIQFFNCMIYLFLV